MVFLSLVRSAPFVVRKARSRERERRARENEYLKVRLRFADEQ
jgi:hypothetical protein